MKNSLMLLVAVLGTGVMVHAFPAKDLKAASAKELKMTSHPKHKKVKKEQKGATTEMPVSKEKK